MALPVVSVALRYVQLGSVTDSSATCSVFDELTEAGWTIKATKLSSEFNYSAFRGRYGPTAVLLFIINQQGRLNILTADTEAAPIPGQTIVALVEPACLNQDSGTNRLAPVSA